MRGEKAGKNSLSPGCAYPWNRGRKERISSYDFPLSGALKNSYDEEKKLSSITASSSLHCKQQLLRKNLSEIMSGKGHLLFPVGTDIPSCGTPGFMVEEDGPSPTLQRHWDESGVFVLEEKIQGRSPRAGMDGRGSCLLHGLILFT